MLTLDQELTQAKALLADCEESVSVAKEARDPELVEYWQGFVDHWQGVVTTIQADLSRSAFRVVSDE